ncbi:MAG: Crp/Fnr family transcriptional regulator [Rhizorhabdus sp.]
MQIPVRTRRLAAGETIVHESDHTGGLSLVHEGLAHRFRILPDGRRAILGYLLPGDFCDIRVLIMDQMDHSIGALAPSVISVFSREAVLKLLDRFPRLVRPLWRSSAEEEAIMREWVVNVGQRSALERLAHLICELHARMSAAGLTKGGSFDLPVTQSEFADSLGLSTVHVNRTLQELRRSGLLTLRGRQAVIPDIDRLRGAGMFSPTYLHRTAAKAG